MSHHIAHTHTGYNVKRNYCRRPSHQTHHYSGIIFCKRITTYKCIDISTYCCFCCCCGFFFCIYSIIIIILYAHTWYCCYDVLHRCCTFHRRVSRTLFVNSNETCFSSHAAAAIVMQKANSIFKPHKNIQKKKKKPRPTPLIIKGLHRKICNASLLTILIKIAIHGKSYKFNLSIYIEWSFIF